MDLSGKEYGVIHQAWIFLQHSHPHGFVGVPCAPPPINHIKNDTMDQQSRPGIDRLHFSPSRLSHRIDGRRILSRATELGACSICLNYPIC